MAGEVLPNPTAKLVVEEVINEGYEGLTASQDVRIGGDAFVRVKWIKGISASITPL